MAAATAVLGVLSAATVALGATSYPNDPFYTQGNQWALRQIGAPLAWCASTGAGVTVADATTGVDFSQPDLAGKLLAGAAFTSGGGDPAHPDATGQQAVSDVTGSGTADAGVVAADTGNGIGVAAVAPSARVLAMRVLGPSLFGNAADAAAAIQWAVGHGARVAVLNFATGFSYFGDLSKVVDAAQFAAAHGAVVVLAAGDTQLGSLTDTQLQALDQVALVVGALGPDSSPASYMTDGRGVNIWAPGGDTQRGRYQDIRHLVVTTGRHGSYVELEGSYLAAAVVAGSAADLLAHGSSAAQAHDRLLSVGRQPDGLNYLNLAAALGATHACGSPLTASPVARTQSASDAAAAPAGAAPAAAAGADDLGVNTAQAPADNRWLAFVIPPIALVVLGGGLLFLLNRRR